MAIIIKNKLKDSNKVFWINVSATEEDKEEEKEEENYEESNRMFKRA